MKSLICISSHCDTEEKISALNDLLNFVDRSRFDILLSTHIPLSVDIQSKVDYYLYNIKNPKTVNGWYRYYIHNNVQMEYIPISWSDAALLHITDMMSYCESIQKYPAYHFLNYDYDENDANYSLETVDYILRNTKFNGVFYRMSNMVDDIEIILSNTLAISFSLTYDTFHIFKNVGELDNYGLEFFIYKLITSNDIINPFYIYLGSNYDINTKITVHETSFNFPYQENHIAMFIGYINDNRVGVYIISDIIDTSIVKIMDYEFTIPSNTIYNTNLDIDDISSIKFFELNGKIIPNKFVDKRQNPKIFYKNV